MPSKSRNRPYPSVVNRFSVPPRKPPGVYQRSALPVPLARLK
ncbi:hypothetical protein [Paludisphaera sp.]